MKDREILAKLVDCGHLTDRQEEAFTHMRDLLAADPERKLTREQRTWAASVYEALDLDSDETLNLFSAGKVPVGIVTPKTDGEKRAIETLKHRPSRPPGRTPS